MSRNNKKLRKLIKLIEKNGKTIEKLVTLINQKRTCVGGCESTNVILYFCSACDASHPVCKHHFESRRKSRICLVCETKGITRRWTMPVHKI